MGMYSSFNYEEIEVKDKEGLKSFLGDWKRANPTWWLNERMIDSLEGEDDFSFGCWDNMKLISYWYSIDVAFLNCVAKYIEGNVMWEFENADESGNVKFENGKCIIETGVMRYTNVTPKDMMGEKMDDINEKTKRLMICSNL